LELLQDIGFVVEDRLAIDMRSDPPELFIHGRIRCLHGLFVDVEKTVDVEERHGRMMARTIDYAYHASVKGDRDRAIFRYDTAHAYKGHVDARHKDRYDSTTWSVIEPPD
jgi:hypothetical protein